MKTLGSGGIIVTSTLCRWYHSFCPFSSMIQWVSIASMFHKVSRCNEEGRLKRRLELLWRKICCPMVLFRSWCFLSKWVMGYKKEENKEGRRKESDLCFNPTLFFSFFLRLTSTVTIGGWRVAEESGLTGWPDGHVWCWSQTWRHPRGFRGVTGS